MPFLTELYVKVGEKGKDTLTHPLEYFSIRFDRTLIVPAGFVTDYASIPKLVPKWVISKLERHRKAAVLHDYLYSKDTKYRAFSRKHCDLIFLDAMKELGVTRWKRWSMFQAVNWFGGFAGYRK